MLKERSSISYIFSEEEQHFTALWTAVSHFALEAVLQRCTAKLDLLRNVLLVVMKCRSSAPLGNTFEKYLRRMFFSKVAGTNPAALLKNDFLHNNF